MDKVKEMNALWHVVGGQLRDEMYKAKYQYINKLTMVDLSILQTIEQNPNLIFKDICTLLGLPKSTLTSAVNRLEKSGLVNRKVLESDKRKYGLELTETGKKAQHEHITTEHVIFQKLLNGLSDSESEVFLHLFSKALKKSDMRAL